MSTMPPSSLSPHVSADASAENCTLTMLPEESRVWTLIAARQGRAHAIGAADLARQSGLSNRDVRRVIKTLIEQYASPIASTPTPPAGYYIPETIEEVLATTESLKSRALSILTRMARLRRVVLPEVLHQLSLELARSDQTRAA